MGVVSRLNPFNGKNHAKGLKKMIMSGDLKAYRASNPEGGAEGTGIISSDKRPDTVKGLLDLVIEQQGYQYMGERPQANFTFDSKRAASYGVKREVQDIFVIRVINSKSVLRHRYDFDRGLADKDFWLESLEFNDITRLVVPPSSLEGSRRYLRQRKEVPKGFESRVVAPPEWPNGPRKQKIEYLSQYLKSL